MEAEYKQMHKIINIAPYSTATFLKVPRVDFLRRVIKLLHLLNMKRISEMGVIRRFKVIKNDVEFGFKQDLIILDIINDES